MRYIRHYNNSSNWYHFTRLQTQKLIFRSPVALSTTVCCMQAIAKTSITRCFSLTTSFTGSGIHATVYSPKCFRCVVRCMIALFWLKININIADIHCCTSCSWRSAVPFSSWSVVVFINTFKNYPELFYLFSAGNSFNTLGYVTF